MNNKRFCLIVICLAVINSGAQSQNQFSKFEARHWGVVLQHKDMPKVTMQENVEYFKDDKASLHIDIYTPPSYKKISYYPL